jgi:phosphoglycerate dehydrogenase-like enzyme
MAKPVVYVQRAGAWYPKYMSQDNLARLGAFATVATGEAGEEPLSPEQLVDAMQGAVAILSLNGIGATDITDDVLKQVGTVKLAVMSHWWHGSHDKARQMWQRAGVEVIDASDGNTEAVAEWTVAAALMGVRRLLEYDRLLKDGSSWADALLEAGLLCESVVGLIGLGRIGRHVAGLFRNLGAEVIGYDAYVSPDQAEQMGVRMVGLQELISTADVVSFHLPVTDETRGMFGAEELSWIKDGAVVVNSARAALFDDAAFMAEVSKNRFTAFLDVFATEPLPVDHPLRSMGNVYISPHIAGSSRAMCVRCARIAIDTLKQHLVR